jgi:hypothetical protein
MHLTELSVFRLSKRETKMKVCCGACILKAVRKERRRIKIKRNLITATICLAALQTAKKMTLNGQNRKSSRYKSNP